MAQNYIQPGDTLNYTVPAAGVTSGDFVAMTDLVGIALGTGVENDVVSVGVSGVYSVAKAVGNAVTIGQKLYLDEDNDQLTTSAEGGSPWGALPLAGYAAAAAESADTLVEVKLIG